MKKKTAQPINLNATVKVKLTQQGIDIYLHRYDKLIARGFNITPTSPIIDSQGFTEFQLQDLMRIYGPHLIPGFIQPFDPVEIYIDEELNK